MRLIACLGLVFLLAACVVVAPPALDIVEGGQRVHQPGVSYVLPQSKSWAAILRSTYQAVFGATAMPKYQTLIASSRIFNIPSFESPKEFLAAIRARTTAEPDTGRFKTLYYELKLAGRAETCAAYQSASKDFGVEARRAGSYTVFQTVGMYCIHPLKPSVGVRVELSRKAPPGANFPPFQAMGSALLESVRFGKF